MWRACRLFAGLPSATSRRRATLSHTLLRSRARAHGGAGVPRAVRIDNTACSPPQLSASRGAQSAGFERAGDLEAARAVRAEMQAAGMGVRKPAGAPAAYKAPAHPDAYHRRHCKQARRAR